jgi:diguanylate cyclase (GGDEF)-like protein
LGAILLFVCSALSAGHAAVAAESPLWRLAGDSVFVRENAFDTSGATAIVQDPQGYIWFGNQAGLVRWDGYRMRTYAPDLDTPGALPDNYVSALILDRRGQLWIGTNAGGLARYDPQGDNFVTLRVGPGGLRDPSVSALCLDDTDGLWIADGAGLEHLDGQSGTVSPVPDKLPGGRVQALLRDRRGNLWLGTSSTLVRRAAGAEGFAPVPVPVGDGSSPGILALFEDANGRVWVGTHAHGAYFQDATNAALQPLEGPAGRSGVMTESIKAIAQARPGEIWLGTANSGLLRVDVEHGRIWRERHDESRPSSLASDEILSLARDRNGWMWVGSSAELSGIDPRPGVIETYFGGSGPTRLVAHASVLSVMPLPDGKIWLGLGEGGVQIIDPARGSVGRIHADPAQPRSALPRGRVTSMVQAPDGSVFLGTQSGLYHASLDGRHIERIEVPQRQPTSEVRKLLVDRDTLWVGGRDGLWALGLAPQGPPVLQRHLEAELGDPRVSVITRGPDGALWIGTFGELLRLDQRTGALTRVPLDAEEKGHQRGWDVSSVLFDPRGRLWVGTFGRGIQVERSRDAAGNRRFQRLSSRDGLPQNGVDMILQDGHGGVWASTDAGIAQIDMETLALRVFRQAQGVGIPSYWTGAGGVTATGALLFGGIGGLTVIHPDRLAEGGPPGPPLVVTEAHVGERLVAVPAASAAAPLLLPAETPSLMVEFAALAFTDPDHQRYSYRLEGFDADWQNTPATRRLASYTNLPPGNYTLQLRSARDNDPWGAPIELPVQVQAAWYQRTAVRAGALLLGLALMGLLVHLRTLYLRRRQNELQRLVAERTNELEQRSLELQNSHEELRQSQDQLEKMAYFDPLTGLPNRRMFNDDLRHLIARSLRGQGDFALVLVDLDGFKQINDQRGHQVGDALLTVVAERLKTLVRDSDRLARLGGDEFAVLLANAYTVERVEAMCARMLASLREPMIVGGQTVQITASLGIAPCPREGENPDELYRAADVALYAAKRSGRDTWRWSMAKIYTYTTS